MTKAAIYARVSTSDKGQDLLNQIQALNGLIKTRGWELQHTYVDEESGGKATRTQFRQMMEDARLGKFNLVLFWSLDRFSREGVYETLEHLKRLDRYGVKFLSLQEQYLDTLGPFGDAVIGILAAVAKLERERISERVKAGMSRAKSQGVKIGRPQRDIDDEGFRKAVEGGWSIGQMAKAFGVGRATIVRRKRELGLFPSRE